MSVALHHTTAPHLVVLIAGQAFAFPVTLVHDVLAPQPLNRIPMASPAVAGSINLRGRIVVALSLRQIFGLPKADKPDHHAVVEFQGQSYSLLVDEVREVLTFDTNDIERPPATLNESWRAFTQGVVKGQDGLVVILEPERFIEQLQQSV